MSVRLARPSTAGLRSTLSDGNLNRDMYDDGWINNARFRAAQNKYLATTSSIFDNSGTRDSLRQERSRQALEDLKRQVAEREAAKRREREEDERIYAAMGIPTSYEPSFQDPEAVPTRGVERRNSYGGADYASRKPITMNETATTVKEAGAGYGGYGSYGGGYGGYGGGYGGGGGGYNNGGYGAGAGGGYGGYGGAGYGGDTRFVVIGVMRTRCK
ncbi:keratin, type II cytoskeletal 1-like [Penaeus indicus]|uniref:keratin, type II cytoskeletal 1-like n=1 Tax=Penaeus indicus TaxID=29960 RepID=UPI00300C46F4